MVLLSQFDSAASQKLINKLIGDCRNEDEERFGVGTIETIDVIKTFCSMHLAVNLRIAFLNSLGTNDDSEKRYYRVYTLVHEFCKLFWKSEVPEYCSGVLSFSDFLKIKIDLASEDQLTYYNNCLKLRLHRQVDSQYFVSPLNACKIIYISDMLPLII